MRDVKLGLIGAGGIAQSHCRSIAQVDGAEIVAVSDVVRANAESTAEKWAIADIHDDYRDLVARDDLAGVVVCTPTAVHGAPTVAALEAGKHVLCEKPMALSIPDADRMIAAAESSGKVLMIGLVLRWFHEFRKLKEIVDSNAVGEVRVARTTRAAGYPRGRDDWYADRARSGGLAMDMITHDYDFLRWCFGEVDRVMARAIDPAGFDHLDYCLVLLRFRSVWIARSRSEPGIWQSPESIWGATETP